MESRQVEWCKKEQEEKRRSEPDILKVERG